MAEVVLVHHAQGLTEGVLAFAGALEGHTVHTPDLYDGKTFTELAEGLAQLQTPGFDEIVRRGAAAAVESAVYVGMSLGAVPVHHLAEDDPEVAGDLVAAREWDAGELFLSPGSAHLFTDRSLPDYDEQAAARVIERVRGFLERM